MFFRGHRENKNTKALQDTYTEGTPTNISASPKTSDNGTFFLSDKSHVSTALPCYYFFRSTTLLSLIKRRVVLFIFILCTLNHFRYDPTPFFNNIFG